MLQQLELVDIAGIDILMLAASTASVAVFTAITQEIRPGQVMARFLYIYFGKTVRHC